MWQTAICCVRMSQMCAYEPILPQASKSVAKRHREEVEASAAQKAAKKLRQEMKQRGHVPVHKKGEDPEADAHEKALYKVATK